MEHQSLEMRTFVGQLAVLVSEDEEKVAG